MIKGNQLKPLEIKEMIQLKGHFPDGERDENEAKVIMELSFSNMLRKITP